MLPKKEDVFSGEAFDFRSMIEAGISLSLVQLMNNSVGESPSSR
jgi:hypothetical protein